RCLRIGRHPAAPRQTPDAVIASGVFHCAAPHGYALWQSGHECYDLYALYFKPQTRSLMAADDSPRVHGLEAPASPQRRSALRAALAGSMLGPLSACDPSDSDSGSGPVDYSATIRDGQAAIAQAMADTDTSSVSVALADGSRLVWQQAFGTID